MEPALWNAGTDVMEPAYQVLSRLLPGCFQVLPVPVLPGSGSPIGPGNLEGGFQVSSRSFGDGPGESGKHEKNSR
jgi:hypothetical protein